MHDRISRLKTLAVLLVLTNLSQHMSAQRIAVQEVDVLSEIWEQPIAAALIDKPLILSLFVSDINDDGIAEISVVTTGKTISGYTKDKNRIYTYAGNGSAFWEYGIDYPVTDAIQFDINNDRNMEYIVVSGEKREGIQRGTLYIIGWNGEKLRSFDSTASMNSVAVSDVDGDSYYEIAVGAERVYIYRSYGEKVWMYPPQGHGLLNKTVDELIFGDTDRDGFKEIVAGADMLYYLDRDSNLQASFDVEPDINVFKKGFKYISILDLSPYRYNEVLAITANNEINAIRVSDVEKAESSYGKYNVLKLEKSWVKAFDCGIDVVKTLNVDADEYSEMLIGCSDHVLRLLDNEGSTLWNYIIDGEIADVAIADMDEDHADDIVVGSSSGTIYVMDMKGNFKYKYATGRPIVKLGIGDLNNDKLSEIVVVSSEPSVKAYSVNQTFSIRRRADMYYNLGRDSYIASKWNEAEEYLIKAKELYLFLDYARGVEDSQTLILKIKEKDMQRKREQANLYYEKAQEEFISGRYNDAKGFLKRAKEAYLEFGDTENVLKCELMELRIESILKGEITPQTIPAMNLSKGNVTVEDTPLNINYKVIAIIAVLALLVIGIIAKKKGGEVEYIDKGANMQELQ